MNSIILRLFMFMGLLTLFGPIFVKSDHVERRELLENHQIYGSSRKVRDTKHEKGNKVAASELNLSGLDIDNFESDNERNLRGYRRGYRHRCYGYHCRRRKWYRWRRHGGYHRYGGW
mmetsp:Transcript_7070/g.8955  ORF Transcript_7070/g.8955 Transcript_7070/m.8955 type:complete len:117 (-) Transcript_7070:26-376(-)